MVLALIAERASRGAKLPDVPEPPKVVQSEKDLPGRHAYVADDILRLCRPAKGFWVDLGAGKGQLAER